MAKIQKFDSISSYPAGLTIDAKTGEVVKSKKTSFLKRAAAGVAGSFAFVGSAAADITTDAQAAISSAQTDALVVGGYVVTAVAALVVVVLVLSMLRKM